MLEQNNKKTMQRDGVSTYHMAINCNKRSVTLDFKDAADLRLARVTRTCPVWAGREYEGGNNGKPRRCPRHNPSSLLLSRQHRAA